MFKKLKRKKEDKKKKKDDQLTRTTSAPAMSNNVIVPPGAATAATMAMQPPAAANSLALPEQGVRAIALYDYSPEQEDEISLQENGIVIVYERDESGWWTGEANGKYGLFPGAYVRFIEKVPGEVSISPGASPLTSPREDEPVEELSTDPVPDEEKPVDELLAEVEKSLQDTIVIPTTAAQPFNDATSDRSRSKYFQDTHDLLEELEGSAPPVPEADNGDEAAANEDYQDVPQEHPEEQPSESAPEDSSASGDQGEWRLRYEEEVNQRGLLERASNEQAALIKKLQAQLAEETRLKHAAEESSAGLRESLNEASGHIGSLEAELTKTKALVSQLQGEIASLKKNSTQPEEKIQQAQELLFKELQTAKQELALSIQQMQKKLSVV